MDRETNRSLSPSRGVCRKVERVQQMRRVVRGGIVGSSTELGISIGATLRLDFTRFQASCQIIGGVEYAVEYWSLVAVNNV